MKDKFLITFAGPMGSSKTPIAHYLSCKLNLPIFSNDSIRTEVIADKGSFDEKEYLKRRDARLEDIVRSGISFIYDASADREWIKQREKVEASGYRAFIISIDLSKEFLASLYGKGIRHNQAYSGYLAKIDETLADHESFLEHFANEVGLHINDVNFADRLEMSYEGVKNWLNG